MIIRNSSHSSLFKVTHRLPRHINKEIKNGQQTMSKILWRQLFCGRSHNSVRTRMYSHAKERCTDLSQQLFANKHTQTDTIIFALTDVRRKTIDLTLSQFCTSLTITRRSYEVHTSQNLSERHTETTRHEYR